MKSDKDQLKDHLKEIDTRGEHLRWELLQLNDKRNEVLRQIEKLPKKQTHRK